MQRARFPRVLVPFGLAALLAPPLACTKSGEATDGAVDDKPAEAPAAADARTETPKDEPSEAKPGGLAEAVTESVTKVAATSAGRLDRSNALGHFVVPNASRLLEEVRTQAAPPKGAAFLNEATLRSLASMGLGARAKVAEHVALDQPMGCVLLDDAATAAPVACAVGYAGGAAAAAADLGSEGKQADAEGHVAHYRVDGQDLYLDDLGGHLVVTNHPAVFAKAQAYLGSTVLGRASEVADDVEVVLYPKAAAGRYAKEIEGVLALARSVPAVPEANPFAEAFTEYSRSSLDRSMEYYREIDQVDVGMGLEPVGFVMRYAVHPTPGSSAQSDTQAVASGPVDLGLVQQLPAESWLLSASTVDWKAAWQLESVVTMRDVSLEAYASAVGRDAAMVRTAIEAFLEENGRIYASDAVAGVMHLPGTQGGLVVSRKLLAPGRESWRAWSTAFDPAVVLGPKASAMVTWSFQPDAMEVEGVAVDRWTIEPGPEGKAKLAAEADPVIAELERRFGGLKLEIDRVELPDRVLFVVAPGAQERYVRAAIMAAKGGPSTGSDAGLRGALARNAEPSVLMAVDVAGALGWAREVLPPEATRSLPAALGVDLGDFYFAATYGAGGEQRGEMVLSQAMIDELRKLAG